MLHIYRTCRWECVCVIRKERRLALPLIRTEETFMVFITHMRHGLSYFEDQLHIFCLPSLTPSPPYPIPPHLLIRVKKRPSYFCPYHSSFFLSSDQDMSIYHMMSMLFSGVTSFYKNHITILFTLTYWSMIPSVTTLCFKCQLSGLSFFFLYVLLHPLPRIMSRSTLYSPVL